MSRGSRIFLFTFLAVQVISFGLADSHVTDHQLTYPISFSPSDLSLEKENGFDRIILKGSASTLTAGSPMLPVKTVCLLLPANTEVVDVLVSAEQHVLLGEYSVLPTQSDEKTDGSDTKEWTAPDSRIYDTDSPFPGKRAELLEEGYLGGNHLVILAVYPLEYFPQSKRLLFYNQINITVELRDDVKLPRSARIQARTERMNRMYEEILHQMVSNREDISSLTKMNHRLASSSETPDSSQSPAYLIVTASDLESAFLPLVDWKTKKGIKAGTVSMESILSNYTGRDDAEKLRNFLIEAYQKGTIWVLLGGDEHVVPIRYAYPTNTTTIPSMTNQQICDLYFSDVDGDWDLDNDGVWGEPQQDRPDLFPDLFVGRVPCGDAAEAQAFVEKLLSYEKNPGNGSLDYLTSALWLCSDQMRDWSSGEGQHVLVSPFVPSGFSQDLYTLIESPTGGAENPTGPNGGTCIDRMNQGWGIIGVLAHGKANAFVSKSNLINGSPKSWVSTLSGKADGNGYLPDLGNNQKYGIMYSISCSQSAIDVDEYPYLGDEPCVGEYYPLASQKGGVAFLGYSRWGWVSVSYLLFEKFLEYLTNGNPEHHIGVAEALSRCEYPSYRDLNYGHNLFGDPEMQVWTDLPLTFEVVHPQEVNLGWQTIIFTVTSSGMGVKDAFVTLTLHGEIKYQGETDQEGYLSAEVNLDDVGEMSVVVTKTGYLPYEGQITVSLAADVNEDENSVGIESFELSQNYPNPFNPVTSIRYSVSNRSKATHTSLKIYNILGQKVRSLVDGFQKAGNFEVVWDGKDDKGNDLSSGIYFYTLVADDYRSTRKMTFLK
ncbi:MAG: C25 family cysteine peptidase [Candidatus Zixiibacteriota bacterium]